MKKLISILTATALVVTSSYAHDIWIEASSSLIRTGDWVQLSLMLGNHGNEHRDFKLASKVTVGDQNLAVYDPKGAKLDLTSSLFDGGYTPQEGYWSTRFHPSKPGLYLFASTFDKVMSYAPVRDIKSAKTFVLVSDKLDKVPSNTKGFDRVLGHPFEIVPMVHPITPFGPGSKIQVKVLYKGQPMPGAKVSFLPRGSNPAGELDPRFEMNTNAKGVAEMELKEANTYLIVTHFKDPTASGEGYKSIGYSASLTLIVPGICPCCQ